MLVMRSHKQINNVPFSKVVRVYHLTVMFYVSHQPQSERVGYILTHQLTLNCVLKYYSWVLYDKPHLSRGIYDCEFSLRDIGSGFVFGLCCRLSRFRGIFNLVFARGCTCALISAGAIGSARLKSLNLLSYRN